MARLKRIELWIRDLLIALCIFVFLYAFVQEVAIPLKGIIIWSIPLYIPMLIVMSFPLGQAVRKAVTDIFCEEEGDETFDETSLVYQYLGIIVLYFMVHFAIAFLITTTMGEFKLLNVFSLSILAGLNCYYICLFYKRYIL